MSVPSGPMTKALLVAPRVRVPPGFNSSVLPAMAGLSVSECPRKRELAVVVPPAIMAVVPLFTATISREPGTGAGLGLALGSGLGKPQLPGFTSVGPVNQLLSPAASVQTLVGV